MVQAARSMIVARRALTASIPVDLIHDPSLDMLLALFMAPGHRLPSVDLHVVTTVSGRAAARWVDAMAAANLVEPYFSPANVQGRRLTAFGLKTVKRALADVIASQRTLALQDLH